MEFCNYDLENLVTPIRHEVLGKLLQESGYDPNETQFLIDGFQNGFDLCYFGPVNRQSQSQNLPFTVGDKQILWNKLLKEIKLGRVAGPFERIPFDTYIQSPIGLVPKDKGLETRLIFHLSYDFSEGSKSVNFHTLAHLCSVHYSDLDAAVRLCLWLQRHGTGTVFFSKTNGKSAFRVLPLKRSSLRWVVMKASDPKTGKTMYFVDKCLPFRSSISCSHFQRVSNALKHLAEYQANKRNFLSNYLDNFLFLACLM